MQLAYLCLRSCIHTPDYPNTPAPFGIMRSAFLDRGVFSRSLSTGHLRRKPCPAAFPLPCRLVPHSFSAGLVRRLPYPVHLQNAQRWPPALAPDTNCNWWVGYHGHHIFARGKAGPCRREGPSAVLRGMALSPWLGPPSTKPTPVSGLFLLN